MKYKSHYESVQNCTPAGTELQQILNGECGDFAALPADQTKSITSLISEHNKKSVKRKTCTCSSGSMVPCPSHSGTERSSINGYTNSCTHIKCDHMKSTRSKINLNQMADNNHLPLQCCNGKNTKTNQRGDDTLPEANESEEDALLSSRTFKIESSKHHTNNNNNCDNSKKGHPSVNSNLDELRLSLTSLISKDTTIPDDDKHATEAFQKWLAEKKRQEREIRQRELNLKQLIEQEKQRKIQMEQENFLNWLHAKKQKERQERESKKKALQEEQRRKNEKLKREEINKKQYQLWLKLKEEQDLVKKINEQKRKIEKEERERLRLARNQSAFQEWLISSKDKPKPVPLNRGLESLRTSTSVAFVNPAPWVPNIVEKTKASSK